MKKVYGLFFVLVVLVLLVVLFYKTHQDRQSIEKKVSVFSGFVNHEKAIIEQQMFAQNNKQWPAKFNVSFFEDFIEIEILIQILSEQSVSGFDLNQVKQNWLDAIDAKYNNRFSVNAFSETIPLVFKVKFSSYKGAHRVVVGSNRFAIDTHHWSVLMDANIAAHEVGHFIGAFDEYSNGATNEKEIYKGSLMGKNTKTGEMFPRHLKLIESKLSEILSTKAVVVLQMENEYEN
ncbi:hypothetical protein [Marinicellulosiphila megalodicopiae]|uniref:hypothetical protein n=1 Tax=Marinicellulosiphila megalodicopiae TaxID=2724896 RepID=UPI003BB0B1BF